MLVEVWYFNNIFIVPVEHIEAASRELRVFLQGRKSVALPVLDHLDSNYIFGKVPTSIALKTPNSVGENLCELCGEKLTLKNELINHTEKAHTKKADSETEFTCSDAKHARNAVENIVTLPQTTQTNWRNTREAHMNKSHEIEHKEASVEPNV